MMKNIYEYQSIRNNKLPEEWKSQTSLDELAEFLQQNWEQRSVFYNDEKVESRQQFLDFLAHGSLKTKNYIGTILFKGHRLNIFPKMFKYDKGDVDTDNLDVKHLMHNLVQWIEYCNKLNYPYVNITTELDDSEDLKELFVTLYVHYVKNALDRGLFYRYEDKVEDCSAIKGKVNIKDYFVRKYPNGKLDKFECEYSEFEIDNTLNKIIKYTCKTLLNDDDTSVMNQKRIRHILMMLNEVSDVRCTPHDCDTIRLSKLHRHYGVILSMSKMFLLNKTSTYNVDDTESFCFLFPTEVLFEGFVGGFLQSILEDQARVILQASDKAVFDEVIYRDVNLGKAITMRHDILVEHKEKGVFVLDTKYKELSRFSDSDAEEVKTIVQREADTSDIYQMITYARTRGLHDVYLLYPLFREEDLETYKPPVGINKDDNKENPIRVHLVRLPFVFEEDIEETKDNLKKVLLNIFNEQYK